MDCLKLTSLSKGALGAREMRNLVGGNVCGCACNGSSSTQDNGTANHAGGKRSKGTMEQLQWFIDEVVVTPEQIPLEL